MFRRRRARWLALPVVTALLLSACTSSTRHSSQPGPSTTPPVPCLLSVGPSCTAAPGSTTPGGGTTTPSGPTDTGPTDQPAAVAKCSISEIGDDGTCTGPERPGIESLSAYTREGSIPTFTGQPGTANMFGYLTTVVKDIAKFWSEVYAEAGIKGEDGSAFESSVRYHWLAQGETIQTGCNPTKVTSLFYCSLDDTMYVSVPAILADWLGGTLPGETKPHPATGEGSAIYTIAHEYAHNVQEELGIIPGLKTQYIEQEADCLAGVYLRGGINLDDDSNRASFQNVIANADFSGDFAFDDPGHHGTPDERMIAVLQGHDTADPSVCEKKYEE
jgi:predicted metalloprotease